MKRTILIIMLLLLLPIQSLSEEPLYTYGSFSPLPALDGIDFPQAETNAFSRAYLAYYSGLSLNSDSDMVNNMDMLDVRNVYRVGVSSLHYVVEIINPEKYAFIACMPGYDDSFYVVADPQYMDSIREIGADILPKHVYTVDPQDYKNLIDAEERMFQEYLKSK